MEFAKEKTIESSLTKTPEEKEMFDLDVCFMLDSTGSMQPTIDMARDKIKEIISQLKSQYSDSKVRIAIVAYRDFGDKDQYMVFSFNESVDAAHKFLASLIATGGNDYPEDVNGGFQQALKLKWKTYTTKMLYHLADAPCHGKKFHTGGDNFPDGHKNDESWDVLFKNIYEKDINYLYFDIGGRTSMMHEEFKKIYYKCGEEKTHLIFNYEVLIVERNVSYEKSTKAGFLTKSKNVKLESASVKKSLKEISSFKTSEEVEKKESASSEMFVKATVMNARAQMISNISYQSAKFNKK